MGGFSTVHWLIFGTAAVMLYGNRIPSVARSFVSRLREFEWRVRDFHVHVNSLCKQRKRSERPRPELPYRLFRLHHEEAMRKLWKKFVWTPKFWAMLGILGCISGAYFQRVASNGCGLWCLGLVFLGAAYLEQHEYWPG